MKRKILFCISFILVVLVVLSVCVFAEYKKNTAKTENNAEESVKIENNIKTITYSADDINNTKESLPKYSEDNFEVAKQIAEENYEMLLNMAKEAITQKYPNFANIDPDNFDIGIGYSCSGVNPKNYGVNFTFWHSLCGITTNEYYTVTIYTKDGVNFEANCVMANLKGVFSSFEDNVTNEVFEVASNEVISKFEEKLAACKTDEESAKLWLRVCDCPVGIENHRDMLHWKIVDENLYLCFGAYVSEFMYKFS